jgi:hypothetical protein
MPRLAHSQARSASLALAGTLAVLVGGCGGAEGGRRRSSEQAELVYGERPAPAHPAELHSVASAAWSFARAYAAAPKDSGGESVPATPSVLRQLRSLPVRLGPGDRAAPQIVSLALNPRSPRAVAATITLRQSGGASYPISFVLRLIGGRWLVAALPGN